MFFKEHILKIRAYEPGKPIEELERELGIPNSIKMASNENPLGPSTKAIEAIKSGLKNIHYYPDSCGYYLRHSLKKRLGVSDENIILGNGSNEIIELIIRAFVSSNEEVIISERTFIVYKLISMAINAKIIEVPMKGYTYDIRAIMDKVSEATRLVFIANPNNPTGTIVKKGLVKEFISSLPESTIVVFDEAYYEYVEDSDFPDILDYINKGENIFLLRTFSKIFGLAGLRIGYGIAKKGLINYVSRLRQPFNINSLALLGACAALDDNEHIRESFRLNSQGKQYLYKELSTMGIEYVPTEANFILIKVKDGTDIYNKLLHNGIIVRPMNIYGLTEHIRVTIGRHEENMKFIEILKKVI